MKKNYTILIALFIGINSIHAQSYIKMIDTTNVWDALCGGITTNGEDLRQTDKLCFIGDTLINDTVYQKLYAKINYTINDSSLQYICALREDSIQQRIYRRNCLGSPTTEGIIFDFSLQQGDSIVLSVDYYNIPNPIRVDSIHFENFAGKLRRRFYITYFVQFPGQIWVPYNYEWIEGIGKVQDGKIKGPIYNINPGADDDNINPSVEELLCFWQSGQMLYQNSIYMTCLIIHLGIKESEKIENNNIFPNPTNNKLNIGLLPKTGQSTLIIIYDTNGQELLKYQTSDDKLQIDISNLASGIYFVKLINEKTVEITKILKK